VISRLRHLPVPWTQLPHHNVTIGPQRPTSIQLLAPELLASGRLVWRELCRDCGTGVVSDSCVLGVDLSLGGADVVCWLIGSSGGGGGGCCLRCGVTVWVRVGVPFGMGDIRIASAVIVVEARGMVVIVAVGSRVAVITGCRSLWSNIVVAICIVWSRCRITGLLRSVI
jgi:hypothetical protein